MAYEVDPKTLLFTDAITWSEATELLDLAQRTVMSGYVNLSHPAFVAWAKAANYNETQQLMVMHTSFPQRALLSLTRLLFPRLPGVPAPPLATPAPRVPKFRINEKAVSLLHHNATCTIVAVDTDHGFQYGVRLDGVIADLPLWHEEHQLAPV